MDATTPAVLLIADISGFTKFMRLHALSTSHARQIIVRLLKALVDVAKPPLQVAELEGDAVFFYALGDGAGFPKVAENVKEQILRFFFVFEQEIEDLQRLSACVCDACTTVGQLKLKQVVHTGEVALEQIDRFKKLFGLDVIVVHRLLKNSIQEKEYLMLTRAAYDACSAFYDLEPERHTEEFEGVGAVDTLVYYAPSFVGLRERVAGTPARAPFGRLLKWKLKMHGHTLLELARLRKTPSPF